MEVQHLTMIQGVINRLAGNSFSIKGWSITVFTALLGLAVNNNNPWLAVLAVISGIAFWILDAYYLMLERRYRRLFNRVVNPGLTPAGKQPIPAYSLDSSLVADEVTSLRQTARRPAVAGTHGPLVFIALGVAYFISIGTLKHEASDKGSSSKTSASESTTDAKSGDSQQAPAPRK